MKYQLSTRQIEVSNQDVMGKKKKQSNGVEERE